MVQWKCIIVWKSSFHWLLNFHSSFDNACISVFSSVQRFENMLSDFRMDTNPKQDTETELPRQQEEPWLINDQDLERNKTKVWDLKKRKWKKRKYIYTNIHFRGYSIYLSIFCECHPESSLWVSVSASDSSKWSSPWLFQGCCLDCHVSPTTSLGFILIVVRHF